MNSAPSSEEICRVLSVVDGTTEEVIDLHVIEPFNLVAFCEQFDVPVEHDPEMMDKYSVGPDDVAFLTLELGIELPFDFSRNAYFIEAVLR